MALTLNTRYGNRATEPSIDYPTGGFKNKSAPDAVDGTPLEKDWANDFLGSRDAILKAAGILANGTAETSEASQVLEALNTIYKALATEVEAGISRKSTVSEAQALVSDEAFLTPKKLADSLAITVLGRNQSWQSLLASRAIGVTYTNTSLKPILVVAGIGKSANTPSSFSIQVDAVGGVTSGYSETSAIGINIFATVPPGNTYTAALIGDGTLIKWWEYK